MRRVLWLVSAVVLVDMMFYAAVAPLLPHYTAEFGLSKSGAGVLAISYAVGTVIGSLPGGWLVGRIGPKATVLVGLALFTLASLAFGVANTIGLLDAARFVQGVGGAFTWAAGMAWLMAVAAPDRRGQVIGTALGAAVVGLLLGPVIGGLATAIGDTAVFSGVAVIALALAGWAWSVPGVDADRGPGLSVLRSAFRHRTVVFSFWLFVLPSVFAGVLEVLVPLRLSELGANGVAIGAAFLAASVFEVVLNPVSGRWSDARGRVPVIRVGLAGAFVMAIVLPLPGSALLVAAVLVAAVAAVGVIWTPAMALVSEAAEKAGVEQGLAFAIANLGWAAGHIVGGGGGAALADATADAVPYALLALLCGLTLAALSDRTRSGYPQLGHGEVPLRR
jgi:MFS family permease